MNELHKNQYNPQKFEPHNGQTGLLCGDKTQVDYLSLKPTLPLSKETISALEELGDVLKCIHRRMLSEGYEMVDGVIRKKELQM